MVFFCTLKMFSCHVTRIQWHRRVEETLFVLSKQRKSGGKGVEGGQKPRARVCRRSNVGIEMVFFCTLKMFSCHVTRIQWHRRVEETLFVLSKQRKSGGKGVEGGQKPRARVCRGSNVGIEMVVCCTLKMFSCHVTRIQWHRRVEETLFVLSKQRKSGGKGVEGGQKPRARVCRRSNVGIEMVFFCTLKMFSCHVTRIQWHRRVEETLFVLSKQRKSGGKGVEGGQKPRARVCRRSNVGIEMVFFCTLKMFSCHVTRIQWHRRVEETLFVLSKQRKSGGKGVEGGQKPRARVCRGSNVGIEMVFFCTLKMFSCHVTRIQWHRRVEETLFVLSKQRKSGGKGVEGGQKPRARVCRRSNVGIEMVFFCTLKMFSCHVTRIQWHRRVEETLFVLSKQRKSGGKGVEGGQKPRARVCRRSNVGIEMVVCCTLKMFSCHVTRIQWHRRVEETLFVLSKQRKSGGKGVEGGQKPRARVCRRSNVGIEMVVCCTLKMFSCHVTRIQWHRRVEETLFVLSKQRKSGGKGVEGGQKPRARVCRGSNVGIEMVVCCTLKMFSCHVTRIQWHRRVEETLFVLSKQRKSGGKGVEGGQKPRARVCRRSNVGIEMVFFCTLKMFSCHVTRIQWHRRVEETLFVLSKQRKSGGKGVEGGQKPVRRLRGVARPYCFCVLDAFECKLDATRDLESCWTVVGRLSKPSEAVICVRKAFACACKCVFCVRVGAWQAQ
jgi:hypothetical protein